MTTLTIGFASNVGLVRRANEDSLFVGNRICAVADGMGGHAAGDVASTLVVLELQRIDAVEMLTEIDVINAIQMAHMAVQSYGINNPQSAGLGTTATGIAVLGEAQKVLQIFNVGDSRVYRHAPGQAPGRLLQLTVDHSEVQEMIAAGTITPAEARVHASRSVITRSVGQYGVVHVDSQLVPVRTGDRYLICSDGLSSEATDEEIEAILAEPLEQITVQGIADKLVALALRNGGRDNVSVIVVDVDADSNDMSGRATAREPVALCLELNLDDLESTIPNANRGERR